MASTRRLPLIGALALIAAAAAPRPVPDDKTTAALKLLVAKDLRVATISYRLQTAAFDHCPDHTRLSGLVVQDASQYRADLRPDLATLYGMTDLPAVTAVVPHGAGDAAKIRPGDSIVSIDGADVAAELPGTRSAQADGRRFTLMMDRLDAAFAAGPVTLRLRRADAERTVTLAGARACWSATQLDLSTARNAGADGHIVSITQGIADFARTDDELAFVIGHELSHNILGIAIFSTARARAGECSPGSVAMARGSGPLSGRRIISASI